ncbi:MAG: hypothetical protein ACYDC2_02930 [Solirubrobacteraceae bacterium]
MIELRSLSTTAGVLAAGIVLASAGVASAASLNGTVVHSNKRAHSIVVADARGHLHAVHVSHQISAAQTVSLSVHKLRNGTLGASKVRIGHSVHMVRVRGRVTYVDPARRAFVVSARGVSLVVQEGRGAKLASASSVTALPALGAEVTVSGPINPSGDLTANTVHNDGEHNNNNNNNNNNSSSNSNSSSSSNIDLEGYILSIDDAARTITISADDTGSLPGASILVHMPSTFDLTGYEVGETLSVVASLNADGSYAAVDTFGDGSEEQAEEQDCQTEGTASETEAEADPLESPGEGQPSGECEPA